MSTRQMMSLPPRRPGRPTTSLRMTCIYGGAIPCAATTKKAIQSALDYFDQALKADPKFALAYTGVADASLRMNSIKKDSFWTQKALAAAQQAQQLNDKLPEVHATLGSVYRATGKYSEAVAELNRALSLAPNSDEFYRRLGDVYLDSGNDRASPRRVPEGCTAQPVLLGKSKRARESLCPSGRLS